MRWKQLLQGVGEGIGIFLLLALLFVAYGSINNRWYRLLVVESGSMSPTFEAGDLILITPAPPTRYLRPGVVVSFQTRNGKLVTHRIVGIDNESHITTKGDVNDTVDVWRDENDQEYRFTRVGGIYRGRLPYLGYPVAWLADLLRPVTHSVRVFLTRAEFRETRSTGADFSAIDQWPSSP